MQARRRQAGRHRSPHAERRGAWALGLGVAAGVAAVALGAPVASGSLQLTAAASSTASANARIHVPASAVKLLGQRIMVGLPGTRPDAGLLRRIREGRVGAVILFARNIVDYAQVTALTGALQRAARQGNNPRLLIAIDQEGGEVKRFANGPPSLAPPQIAATGSTTVAFRQGRATGRYLKARGINMDLAPVVDVPTFGGAFIWQEGRAFSFSANLVARYATQFALGLQSAGIAATAKHFPGVGSAAIDTDNQLDELHPTNGQRVGALKPYEALIPRGLDAIMLSTAGFPAYDATGTPTALSARIIHTLLRGRLNFRGVAITDALGTPTGHDEITAGVLAANAGADVLLYTDSADGELPALKRALGSGRMSRAEADASYERIAALKQQVAGG